MYADKVGYNIYTILFIMQFTFLQRYAVENEILFNIYIHDYTICMQMKPIYPTL